MTTLVAHLYRRLMKRSRVIWLILLASIPGLIFAVVGIDAEPGELEAVLGTVMVTVGFSYAIAALILTVSTLRDERDAGTLPYLYMRPIPRLTIAMAAMLAGIMAAATIAVGGWLSTVLAGLMHGADMSVVLPGAVLLLAAAVGYAAVFVPLGYLFSRSVLVGLGYLILVELVLAPLVAGLAQISVWQIASSIYVDLLDTAGLEEAELLQAIDPGAGGGLIKLAVILLVGTGVLTWALRTRDAL
ncbi:MAG TPA: ABC transporter permease [Acidimicrobiia bacterium]|nr:ABC transporter permease [Acidimicrobiia bacterium]